ncbi:glutamate synthase (NADPH/NADH) small chain [Breznakia sp. PF5-3]|uniref:NAD(P)-dependent oxidoreductase n=1 Tax=unclassified Breznakia TaxID=2623764 RepID=UPI002405FD1F|nr:MULTISPECIES: NAD(P)-dependent oxidoreductase [unclassified Breznakia]MDF9823984.1 glutamate synthase (NADPH/NADH) small chain [Breznakia sp. PM6-1]MDF9834783.1 glutamate synthase (NADPH/NADH) small chain [Breznakia sp. PF5-3]MDF9838050.1 glutamate synthase (NADPH/NADH) small chain [Breznakia sp. PFB2-8]MDF9860036.1 glutamate synthase (NADPH/NADH) small chain [Breznakia sp. PH5-24]
MINILQETQRCLRCKAPFCQKGCPISTPIPQVIDLLENDSIDAAGELLFNNNPLSIICALVCNHEQQCEGNCILNKKQVPIQFSAIENYISDTYFDKMTIPIEQQNNKKVAIIGSGPAGITISLILAKLGYNVTIFESRSELGGVLRYGIPEFRLPKSILERYHKKLLDIGVKIRLNVTIGGTLKIDDLFRDGYLSIFAGTGTWRANSLGIEGESFGHVHYAIDYLASPESFHLGDNVVIIGMGNAAMDVARTALRNGAKQVTLYARSNKISANTIEYQKAKLDGADFRFHMTPVKITDTGIIFKEDANELHVQADSIIISVSQGPKDKLTTTTEGLNSSDKGLLITDSIGNTTRPGIFAAGDVVHGAKTVVEAVNQAKLVAQSMHEYMQKI